MVVVVGVERLPLAKGLQQLPRTVSSGGGAARSGGPDLGQAHGAQGRGGRVPLRLLEHRAGRRPRGGVRHCRGDLLAGSGGGGGSGESGLGPGGVVLLHVVDELLLELAVGDEDVLDLALVVLEEDAEALHETAAEGAVLALQKPLQLDEDGHRVLDQVLLGRLRHRPPLRRLRGPGAAVRRRLLLRFGRLPAARVLKAHLLAGEDSQSILERRTKPISEIFSNPPTVRRFD